MWFTVCCARCSIGIAQSKHFLVILSSSCRVGVGILIVFISAVVVLDILPSGMGTVRWQIRVQCLWRSVLLTIEKRQSGLGASDSRCRSGAPHDNVAARVISQKSSILHFLRHSQPKLSNVILGTAFKGQICEYLRYSFPLLGNTPDELLERRYDMCMKTLQLYVVLACLRQTPFYQRNAIWYSSAGRLIALPLDHTLSCSLWPWLGYDPGEDLPFLTSSFGLEKDVLVHMLPEIVTVSDFTCSQWQLGSHHQRPFYRPRPSLSRTGRPHPGLNTFACARIDTWIIYGRWSECKHRCCYVGWIWTEKHNKSCMRSLRAVWIEYCCVLTIVRDPCDWYHISTGQYLLLDPSRDSCSCGCNWRRCSLSPDCAVHVYSNPLSALS